VINGQLTVISDQLLRVRLFYDDLENNFQQFVSDSIYSIVLLYYPKMSTLASRKRSSSGWHDAAGVEGLVGSFILAGLMEDPVFVKVMAGAQGAKPQYGLGAGQAPNGRRSHPCGPLPGADRRLR